uniref:Uncharacterized protein n=1 Tax=Arundo donax TaxID=35708 RepID=A0A0A9BF84_ARUDO
MGPPRRQSSPRLATD